MGKREMSRADTRRKAVASATVLREDLAAKDDVRSFQAPAFRHNTLLPSRSWKNVYRWLKPPEIVFVLLL